MTHIVVINGPNLNLLGSREPEVYGTTTLDEIGAALDARAGALEATVELVQSNHEGELVDVIQRLRGRADGAILNLGAYTHSSLAIRDALLAAPIPFVEVHLSNLFAREASRHRSMTADLAMGMVTGFGARGYLMALEALVETLRSAPS
ncbi:MAG: type II 3-dehydroquinate dehydratase [Gemmatimonadales bacterium]